MKNNNNNKSMSTNTNDRDNNNNNAATGTSKATDQSPRRAVLRRVVVQQFGQSKVCDLHLTRALHQHVTRGQVSVDDASLLQVSHALWGEIIKGNTEDGLMVQGN